MYWETRCYFSARKHQANVISGHAGIPPDCVRLAEKLALVAFRMFPHQPIWFHATECCVCRFKSVPTWWQCGPIGAWAARLSPARIFVLLSSLLLMLSGEIYLRLEPILSPEGRRCKTFGTRSCCNKKAFCTLKQNIGGTSCGFTNIKSNKNV